MASASAAASLGSSPWPPSARTVPPWRFPLRSPPPHVAIFRNVGESCVLRSTWRGGLAPVGWRRHPVVAAAAGGNYNVQVVVREDEPEEEVVRRFRGAVLRAGIIQECKRRRFFEDRQAERKRRARESAKRNRKRRPRSGRFSSVDKRQDGLEEDEEEEDNWELPGGDLPY